MRVSVLITCVGLVSGVLFTGNAAADEIENIINQASTEEYQSYLRVLTGVEPVPGTDPVVYLTNRYSYYDEIHVAAQWIYDHFGSLGLDTSFHEFDRGLLDALAPKRFRVLHEDVRKNPESR